LSFPSSPPPVPAVVQRLAAGRPVRAVWVNEEGGATFRVGTVGSGVSGAEFIKVANANGAGFAGEAERLRWAARYVTVPRVLGWA
jgi:kanamycin kinase